MKSRNVFAELKRRNVYKVAAMYAVVGWLLIQIATQVFPFFEIPIWGIRFSVLLIIIGFPIALVMAWAFDLTPEGIKRTRKHSKTSARPAGQRGWIVLVVIAGLLSVALFFLGRFTVANGTRSQPSKKSIAVMPFESLSEDKSNSYFADGIQEEILTRLSKISDLKVISRTSTQKYKSAPVNLREIAQQLGVSNILEGSVQKAAEKVRVTVQLINAENDSPIWSESYDRTLIDVLEVESDVAEKIASALEAKLTGKERAAINSRGTKNTRAYEAYLHAIALRASQSEQDQQLYIKFCRQAVEIDPNYAEAWAELAGAEADRYFFPEHTEAQKERTRIAAENALRLAPELAVAHTAMGLYRYYCLRDYDGALANLEEAQQLAPNDWKAISSMALVKRRQGKVKEAIVLQKQAIELDPLDQNIWVNLARSYAGIRQFSAALDALEHALKIEPNSAAILVHKANAFVAQGDLATGWQLIKDIKFAPTDRDFSDYIRLLTYQRRYGDAAAYVSAALDGGREIPPAFVAFLHAELGHLQLAQGQEAEGRAMLIQAESELKQAVAYGDSSTLFTEALMLVEAELGHRAEVERLAKLNVDANGPDRWQLPVEEEAIAKAYALLGDFDRALPLLSHALVAPSAAPLTVAILQLDPSWDTIRNDPRFQKLLETKVDSHL